ncbi:GNAT family N-acetyltransferase [Myxococcota bacterium]|nr:GNAT family N-acetyltransferase [Myxococcota bacterium]MBU1537019.1 GNAT family N-acetyltransferase [Myxococcota bacterium]
MRYILKRHQERTLSLRLNLPPWLLELLYNWENDITIRHLQHVVADAHAYETLHFTKEEIQSKVFSTTQRENQFFFYLEQEDVPVGFISGTIDPPHLYKHDMGTFWMSLVIGDARARGHGLGRLAMKWGEELAREMGCLRIELGVFAHNKRALRLYQSSGFEEIGRIPEFTWWQNQYHEDIRLEKRL